MRRYSCGAAIAASIIAAAQPSGAADPEIQNLMREIQVLRQSYEGRIADLESKLSKLEKSAPPAKTVVGPATAGADPSSGRAVRDNSFNPSIGVVLNGRFSSYTAETPRFAGFGVGEEGERGKEGFAIDESELNFSASVDDKFYGSVTAAIVREAGEDKIELEEAYVQTLPGLGLPTGLGVKAGRALWTFGYLNEHHTHADDFVDRPLPYRAFLNNAFNDDGIEASWVLPTGFYSEIGGGVFRGADFPFGGADGGRLGHWSAFARVGGDIGRDQSWRLGGYALRGQAEGRTTNDGALTFVGDTNLYALDLRYTWAPTGNPRQQEVTLLGEYFWRSEKGTYEDTAAETGAVAFDKSSSGWFAQAVYKFHPQWRVGARYSRLDSAAVPDGLAGSALDPSGHDPHAYAVMADWTNSEFSRLRLQYNRERLSRGEADNQFLAQYVMSIGAHGAHKF